MLSDRDLLRSYFDGHVESLSHLLEKYTPHIVKYVQMIVHDLDLAKDLTQEILIKVSNVLCKNRYLDMGRFKSWIMRIAHNYVIDYIRSSKKSATMNMQKAGYDILSRMPLTDECMEDAIIGIEFEKKMQDIIRSLPKEQQDVVKMRYYDEMSFKEIAKRKGIKINTALGRMHYALINMRKILGKKGNIL